MSLSFGCVYIVHFGTMRSMDRASRWADEARKTRAALFWNIWVLLATPAVWLAWSMIAFCVAILSFVWRTGSQADPQDGRAPLTAAQALGPRVAISAVFVGGLVNFWMIISTFSAYSRISVRRDRRSRFMRGGGGGGGTAAPAEDDRERGRAQRNQRRHKGHPDEEREKERERDREKDAKHASDSMVGLGLGLTGLGQGSPASAAGVILENVDLEKGEAVYLAGERLGALGKLSPRVSPKL